MSNMDLHVINDEVDIDHDTTAQHRISGIPTSDYGSDVDVSSGEEARLLSGGGGSREGAYTTGEISTINVDLEDNPIPLSVVDAATSTTTTARYASLRAPLHVIGEDGTVQSRLDRGRRFNVEGLRASSRSQGGVNDMDVRLRHKPATTGQASSDDVSPPIETNTQASPSNPDHSSNAPLPPDASPLARLRTHPRKPLSVTDLVSPAWCELQYWYALTLHGRKRRTPAMRRGSRLHAALEEQVHTAVEVRVTSREDAFATRVWNTVQGLRLLRGGGSLMGGGVGGGLTRELEVWGTIDGLVVNGVIDEVGVACPDEALEAEAEAVPLGSASAAKGRKTMTTTTKKKTKLETSTDQGTLDRFLSGTVPTRDDASPDRPTRKFYIADIKTRGVRSLPNETAFRPTKYQLMIYHHLLACMATGEVDFPTIASRYRLDMDAVFSDDLLASIASIEGDGGSHSDTDDAADDHSISTILAHNTLTSLWNLMMAEFRLTFPQGAANLGRVLKAEYRAVEAEEETPPTTTSADADSLQPSSSSPPPTLPDPLAFPHPPPPPPPATSSPPSNPIIGSKTLLMDDADLATYLTDALRWWRGDRPARGVVEREAWKCRACEFVEGCEWRVQMERAVLERVRGRRGGGGGGAGEGGPEGRIDGGEKHAEVAKTT